MLGQKSLGKIHRLSLVFHPSNCHDELNQLVDLKNTMVKTAVALNSNGYSTKSDELVEELVSAAIAFGRGIEPDWQTRIEKARSELRECFEEVEAYLDGYDPKVNPPAISQWVLAHSKSFGWRTVKYVVDAGQLYFDEGVSGVGFSVSDCIRWYPLPPEVQE